MLMKFLRKDEFAVSRVSAALYPMEVRQRFAPVGLLCERQIRQQIYSLLGASESPEAFRRAQAQAQTLNAFKVRNGAFFLAPNLTEPVSVELLSVHTDTGSAIKVALPATTIGVIATLRVVTQQAAIIDSADLLQLKGALLCFANVQPCRQEIQSLVG